MPTRHLADDELTRLFAGDLSRFHAARVRRHLADCPACREKQAAIAALWQSAQTLRETHAPDTLRQRIVRMTLETVTPERNRMPYFALRPALGVAAAAVGIVALTAGTLLYAPLALHAPRALAFADVEEAMQSVQTAAWSESVFYPDGKPGKWKAVQGRSMRVRLDPPAQLNKSTGYAGRPGGVHFLTTPRGVLSFTPGETDYFLFDSGYKTPRTASQLRTDFQKLLLFPRAQTEQNAARNEEGILPFKWRETPWKGEKTTLEGKAVLRFSRHSVRYRDDSAFWRKREKQEYDTTIYADPATYRIVRREFEQTKGIGGRARTVSENFRYNETPPDGTFAVGPRTGETVIITDWTKTGLRAPINPADCKAAEAVVRRLAEARNRNDWSAFAALRDFSYEPMRRSLASRGDDKSKMDPSLLNEAAYRAKIESNFKKGLPYQRWQLGKTIYAGYGMNYLYTRPSETSIFPPTTPPDVFQITANVSVAAPNHKSRAQVAEFSVRKSPAGFRVTGVRFDNPPKPRPKSDLSPAEYGARAVFGETVRRLNRK